MTDLIISWMFSKILEFRLSGIAFISTCRPPELHGCLNLIYILKHFQFTYPIFVLSSSTHQILSCSEPLIGLPDLFMSVGYCSPLHIKKRIEQLRKHAKPGRSPKLPQNRWPRTGNLRTIIILRGFMKGCRSTSFFVNKFTEKIILKNALALRQREEPFRGIRTDEGLTLETSASKFLSSGQLTI